MTTARKIDTGEFNPGLLNPFYFIRKGLLGHIATHAPLLRGKLLDFGCGSKPYRALFDVEEYIGLDFENPGHPHDNEQIDVFYDGEKIPFADGHFDSVLCSEVFEHVFNLETVLSEICRVIKPGGQILVTCPFVWNEHEVPNDYARYTRFALTHMMEKQGFTSVVFSKSGNFVTAIFQLINLYFFERTKGSWYKITPLRMLYKVVCFGLFNCLGIFFNAVLPGSQSLYLNNVAVFKKKG